MKKKIIVGILIIALIIIAMIVGICKSTKNNETDINDSKTNVEKTENEVINTNIETSNILINKKDETKEEIINRLYKEELKETYSVETRIDSVKIENSDNLKELYPNVTSNAIFAIVTYSVKDTTRIAGNGKVEGEWVVNKISCVYADKNNDEYKIISSGTGW